MGFAKQPIRGRKQKFWFKSAFCVFSFCDTYLVKGLISKEAKVTQKDVLYAQK